MISVYEAVQSGAKERRLAQAVLSEYFRDKQVVYPINPFQMLTDFGIPFVFRAFKDKNIEGMYLPSQDDVDIPVVAINIKRPITRQRYTAAHELCHYVKDNKNSCVCSSSSLNSIEKYADNFAAELLMPYSEMKRQISIYEENGFVSFSNVLTIADFFGVSFKSCLNRMAYTYGRIEGDIESAELSKRATKYAADKKREALGHKNVVLFEQLIDALEPWLKLTSSDFIKAKYSGSYVFNDSRLEGVNLEKAKVFEIVTDIRLHGTKSSYCIEKYKDEVAVAGHALMYEYLLGLSEDTTVDIFTLVKLHKRLYSCAPYPDFGGSFRRSDPLVIGSKFETVPSNRISAEILELNSVVKHILDSSGSVLLSKYIKMIAQLHHKLTVIHPFGDGNGRATRAFLNLLLIKRRILPIYIRVEEKDEYLDALSFADNNEYDNLFIVIYKALIRAQAELSEAPPL